MNILEDVIHEPRPYNGVAVPPMSLGWLLVNFVLGGGLACWPLLALMWAVYSVL